MAEITNPEGVKFCNDRIRPAADAILRAYSLCKGVSQEWVANNLGAVIPPTSDLVVDGSAQDGRHPITGSDATLVINRCDDLVNDLEANGNAKLNTLRAVAVNQGS